ncbi:MAG: hypothetical protein DLM58_13000 [Pseudonocardiales bacterium]|nr:MAG: hypothetical protein DLM58_13000 [Pseudonocardiales bacterium]
MGFVEDLDGRTALAGALPTAESTMAAVRPPGHPARARDENTAEVAISIADPDSSSEETAS